MMTGAKIGGLRRTDLQRNFEIKVEPRENCFHHVVMRVLVLRFTDTPEVVAHVAGQEAQRQGHALA